MTGLLPVGVQRVLKLYFSRPAWVLSVPAAVTVVTVLFADWLGMPPLSTLTVMTLAPFGGLILIRPLGLAFAFGTRRRDYWLGMSLGFVVSGLVAALAATAAFGVKLAIGRALDPAYLLQAPALGGGSLPVLFAKVLALVLIALFAGGLFGMLLRTDTPAARAITVATLLLLVVLPTPAMSWFASNYAAVRAEQLHLPVVLGGLTYAAVLALADWVAIRRAAV